MGYLPKNDHYRTQFEKEFNNPICYESTISMDTTGTLKYSVLVIGDSFSLQGGFGYINYLCMSDDSLTLLHHHAVNPLETLYGFINSGVFDKISVKYVILQSVERDFVFRSEHTQKSIHISLADAIQSVQNPPKKKDRFHFLNNAPSCVLRYNIMRYFSKNMSVSHVFSFQTADSLFTWRNQDEILIFSDDLERNSLSNRESITELNNKLNELSGLLAEKNIVLIVLPAPDKYTIYYDYLLKKNEFPEPVFFHYMEGVEKNYVYIHSNEILKNTVSSGIKDVYLADDSHWSPIGSKLIAAEILLKIRDIQKTEPESYSNSTTVIPAPPN
jgi:hypothetical protein